MYKPVITVLFLIPILLLLPTSAVGNQLKHHPSPYLAMHSEDPVAWQSWQADVFAKAKQQNKLIFVSVGYFSCHWCHVMQRESYQDQQVAALLNQHFISVKVDRELRPELDRRLIEFVSQIRGSAGWPLNVFLTPDGYPLTGFTYLPKQTFSEVLIQLQSQWISKRSEIEVAAREYHAVLLATNADDQLLEPSAISLNELANAFVDQAMQVADELQGGFGETSKFPQTSQMHSLLRLLSAGAIERTDVSEFVQLSLQAMASRNLMDQVNGGFFRYTTDPDWQTPHFEKMLYDNASLILLYLQAEKLWPGQGYGDIVDTSLAFMRKHMRHPQGGYISSLSAVDVNNKEGGAYLWSRDQIRAALTPGDFGYIEKFWQLDKVLPDSEFLLKPMIGIGASAATDRNRKIRRQLQLVEKPVMPVDDKRLASWNALMLQALVAAAKYDPKYRDSAHELYQFMQSAFFKEGKLIRFAGNADQAESTFEDYAAVASAFHQYGVFKADRKAIARAQQLVESGYRRFFVENRWLASDISFMPAISGEWVIQDAVLPSASTQWLSVALSLPAESEIYQSASQILQRITRYMADTPYYYGSLIALRANLPDLAAGTK